MTSETRIQEIRTGDWAAMSVNPVTYMTA